MKSQLQLLACIIQDMAMHVGYNSNRDVATAQRRFACEGEAFVEETLPALDDFLLQGIEEGTLPVCTGWRRKRGWSHPEFLHGIWMKIFSPNGTLLPTPDPVAIRAIRQISRVSKKIFEVCSDDRVEKAVASFVETDRALSTLRFPRHLDLVQEVVHYAFGSAVGRAVSGPHVFRHGPGAVSEGYGTNSRWEFPHLSPAIADEFGFDQFSPTWETLRDSPADLQEVPARLVAVPKTSLKPRLICIEPSYNQFIQQGYHALLKDELGKIKICSYLDQTPNQALACEGSVTGELVTVDLSEASDRVHYGVVRNLFRWSPAFLRILDASRSRVVQLPNGDELLLNKFASMGSALTFPMETMVFTGLLIAAICIDEHRFGRAFVTSQLRRSDLRVYGDDIICPRKYYPTLQLLLSEFGLKVNTSKSFSKGGFRESCGADYFRGFNVTPVYQRRRLPSARRDTEQLVSLVSFRNQWVSKYSYGEVTSFLDGLISSLIPFPAGKEYYESPKGRIAPTSNRVTSGLCRVGPSDVPEPLWNGQLQRAEIKCMVPTPQRKKDQASWKGSLLKSFLTGLQEEHDHLLYHGRPVSAKLKHRRVAL